MSFHFYKFVVWGTNMLDFLTPLLITSKSSSIFVISAINIIFFHTKSIPPPPVVGSFTGLAPSDLNIRLLSN